MLKISAIESRSQPGLVLEAKLLARQVTKMAVGRSG
jgi:hypothetical protein